MAYDIGSEHAVVWVVRVQEDRRPVVSDDQVVTALSGLQILYTTNAFEMEYSKNELFVSY